MAAASSEDRPREVGVPYFTNYEPKSSTPAIAYQSWAVIQDHRGILYIGNGTGVVEYDGVSWQLLVLPGQSVVRSLARDDSGRIFVGGQGMFGYLVSNPNERTRFKSLLDNVPEEDRQFADVWKTHAAAEGIYFQTFSHLFRWNQGELRTWRPETSFHLSFLVNGTLYLHQEEIGLMRLAGDELEMVPGGEVFSHDRIYVMLPYAPGQVLIGTRNRGLFLMDEQGSTERFPTEADSYLIDKQLYHGTTLGDGTIVLATLRGGAVLIDRQGRLLHILDRALGIQDSSVSYVYADAHGGLWLALERNLSRVEIPATFTVFNEANGLAGAVQSILRHEGTLLVATTRGVYRLNPPPPATRNRPIPLPMFVPVKGIATQSWQLLTVEQGVLAATNDGVFLIRGDRAEAMSSDGALSLVRSRSDPSRLYAGLADGVGTFELRAGQWQPGPPIEGINDQVRTMAEEEDGSVWLGVRYQGLLRISPPSEPQGRWGIEVYDESRGLPFGYGRVRVNRIAGATYFATDRGLLRYSTLSGKLEPASELGPGLAEPDSSVVSIREGANGSIWVNSAYPNGIGVAVPTEEGGYRWHNSPFRKLRSRWIWEVLPEEDEVVWFGTSNGLIRYDPAIRQPSAPELHCLIRTVRARQKEDALFMRAQVFSHRAGPQPRMPYATYELRFEYAAPYPGSEAEMEYQYTLDGFDGGWSSWTREVKKEYSRLPEGEYRFRVRARVADVTESDEASFSFVILPPWHRTWWAYLGYLLLFSVFLFSFVRFYVQRATRRERLEAENQRRVFELKRARRIQRNMLPSQPPDLPFLEIAAVQRTATEVGGDYYDFFPQENGTLFVAVGDATGHGLGAGLMVAATKTALLTACAADPLHEVAAKVNYVLRRVHLGNHLNMALTLVSLRPDPRHDQVTVTAAGGGMAPMYVLRRSGKVEELLVSGVPLGALPDPEYHPVELVLAPNDILVLMSDGVAERSNRERGALGFEGIQRCLEELGRRYHQWPESFPPESVLDHVLSTGDQWADNEQFDDDMTVVVLKILSQSESSRHLV